MAALLLSAMGMVPTSLASRFIEPLFRPWAAVSGGVLAAGLVDVEQLRFVTTVAWRLFRLLIVL